MSARCYKCGRFLCSFFAYCPHCGTASINRAWCPKCGYTRGILDVYCGNCGITLPPLKRGLLERYQTHFTHQVAPLWAQSYTEERPPIFVASLLDNLFRILTDEDLH